MINSYIKAWWRIFDFTGRTNRRDFWLFLLAYILITVCIAVLEGLIDSYSYGSILNKLASIILYSDLAKLIYSIYSLGIAVVALSITIRRIRDVGRSWLWLLIAFIPFLGPLLVIYWLTLPTNHLQPFNKSNILSSLGLRKLSLIASKNLKGKDNVARKCSQCGAMLKRFDALKCEYCGYEN
ncbi:DUF805 domain-containing protein [Prochlorococcus sp. MIT 1300]|uniref:DUF805 domain-containing protein n=1 Tax=Prochlorococcus sp. MIT 1300 TaxID=3096218 RepID=UPI002A74E1EF|nr:DUF805 domain-containing protein [Prochlorococcus sp. MIT 1300]